METATIRQNVLNVLSTILNEPADAFQASPILASHSWDSLASLETLLALEKRCEIKFDLRKFHAARSVDDLVDLVASASAHHQATN